MADVESVDKAIEYYMSGEVLKINIFTIDTQFSYDKRLIYAHLIPHWTGGDIRTNSNHVSDNGRDRWRRKQGLNWDSSVSKRLNFEYCLITSITVRKTSYLTSPIFIAFILIFEPQDLPIDGQADGDTLAQKIAQPN